MSKSEIDASPTKQFFVKMLTRDIELLDAILDLLDNCVDGIVRSKTTAKNGAQKPYEGFHAHITANQTAFRIEDNCGGIPRAIAEKVAFRLGRPTDEELDSLGMQIGKQGTIGLYGIGMKRAIFKMGRRAIINSESNGDAYRVEITPEWLDSGSWKLNLDDIKKTGSHGTRIEVTDLYPAIVHQFSSNTTFLIDLYDAIAQLFSVIMAKGFEVKINNKLVQPVALKLLMSKQFNINPYVFRGKVKNVDVEVVVGFHRDPSKMSQSAEDDDGGRSAAVMKAGWSVICNDRLVLYGDKSEMTGWGTKPVPYFHPQYNSIAGVVTLRSDDPALLPLNTTKRGIEVSVGVYLKVLDYMKEGVKKFIDFTNNWKGHLQDTGSQFKEAQPVLAADVPKETPSAEYKKVGKSRLADEHAFAEEHKPELPAPPKEAATRRISFAKPVDEIREIGEAILDDKDATPSDVGEECFDRTLVYVRKTGKKK